MQKLLIAIAIALGWLIAYVDSRPTWDDTVITVFAVLIISGALAFVEPRRPWQWALAVGIWTPLVEIPFGGQFASLVALLVAFIGAYAGMSIRKVLAPPKA